MLGLLPVTYKPLVTLIALYVLFSTVIKIKNAAIRSIIVYVVFAVVICTGLGMSGNIYAAVGCGLLALLPIVKFLCSKNGLVKNDYRDVQVAKDA